MKFLNLDDLAKSNRTITIGGKEHDVVEMTVENFIETTKQAQALGENPTFKEQVEATVDMILRSVPTVERAALIKLPLEHLTTVVKFIRGDLDEVAQKSAEADAAPEATPGK